MPDINPTESAKKPKKKSILPGGKLTPELMLDASYNAIIAVDVDSKIVYLNARAEKSLKIDLDKVFGHPISTIFSFGGPIVNRVVQTGEPQIGNHIHEKTVKAVLSVVPVIKEDQIIGAVCSLQDMGHFEKSAKKLKSYKKQNILLNAIFNASSDGLWVVDNDGSILDINEAAENIIEVKAEKIIGKNIFEIAGKHVFDISPLPEVFKTKRRVSHLSSVPGSNKTVLSTGTPVFDENGEFILVVGNERDLTELNTTKEGLGETIKMAEKIKDELNELAMLELKNEDFIAESKKIREILSLALKLAHVNASNILITGESGTGKGLLAKFIHKHSTRSKKSFVAINCASLPDTLLEAELFGYEKGAFTGSRKDGKAGLIELAQNGTLFLDEIGEMPLPLQAKLLKYLDDNEIRPLGSTKTKKIECSVIAATNRDLEKLAEEREFREDMFYRLEAFAIQIPPLRERPEDIFELTNFFLKRFNKNYRMKKRIGQQGVEALQLYSFPGNIRELKNLLKRAVVLSETKRIDDFIISTIQGRGGFVHQEEKPTEQKQELKERVFDAEKDILVNGLTQFNSIRALARHLGVSHSTVLRKMKKYGLHSSNK